MRLGVIALEAPPEPGGMQEHARGLFEHLPDEVSIQLFTRQALGVPAANLRIAGRLNDNFDEDLAVLRRAEGQVDAWLALNAGAAAYAPRLSAPMFVYVHGKDGLDPWYPLSRRPGPLGAVMEALKLPGRSYLFRSWRMRRIGEGLKASRHVFANSHFTKAAFVDRFGVKAKQITVIPPGIDEKHLQPLLPRTDGPLRLLTVSRLTTAARRKNIDGVLQALALLKDRLDFIYEVVGGGSDQPRLQNLAVSLGIAARVRFLGRISDEELRRAYARADLFILAVKPDPTDVEGFGMVYAEAAAAGVPSIATASGGVVDAVVDGQTGRLIKTPTPRVIADAIRDFNAERSRYRPEAVQAFARSVLSRNTTARLWARMRALV